MRQFEIEIDGKTFIERKKFEKSNERSFRVTFTSRYAYTERLGFLDLGIYNLSRDTSIKQGSKIRFLAGYEDDLDVIFQGTITTVLQEREGANIVTRLLCISGAADVRGSVSASMGKDSLVTDCIRACATVLGPGGTPLAVKIDESQFKDAPKLVRGYVLEGNALDALDKLAKQFDFRYVVTGDALIIDRSGYPIKGSPQEVSLFTGMIGFPEAEGDVGGIFVRVTVRLRPRIRIASNINLKSEFATYSTGNFFVTPPENGGKLSGTYKVVEISHVGDSWGDRWQTELRVQKTQNAMEGEV